MTNPIEMAMYDISQFFLYPVLLAIAALFVHAFYALSAFAWQAWQRTQGKPAGFELHALRRADPGCDLVALETVAGQNRGNGYIGNGVDVATIVRNFSELLNRQATAATAASAADSARSNSLNQLQEVFSGGTNGLGAAINDMMNAFADLETSPTDSTARNVVLTRMSELASRFRASSTALEEQDYVTKQQIGNDVIVVNSLATQVATLNTQISRLACGSLATFAVPMCCGWNYSPRRPLHKSGWTVIWEALRLRPTSAAHHGWQARGL